MSLDSFKTACFRPGNISMDFSAHLSIFDGSSEPQEIDLACLDKDVVTFGRDDQNDIVIGSPYVSKYHGHIRFYGDQWVIEDLKSTNGLVFNKKLIKHKVLQDGDSIRIDNMAGATVDGVLLVFSQSSHKSAWKTFATAGVSEITIGRAEACHIQLDHISISRVHAKIVAQQNRFYLTDAHSTNGVILNGKKAEGRILLREKDLILITNSKLIFTRHRILYCCFNKGISLEARRIVKRLDKTNKASKGRIICNGIDLCVNPGEMVALVGGSGAGKSTLMTCLNGYSQPGSGHVVLNGVDLYENFATMKNIIGYVPQSDIVCENLSIYDMLGYAARLRLPRDLSAGERQHRIQEVLQTLELTESQTTLIRHLSGGQRKRASIAVELLADPSLFFLDEPDSGLDPCASHNLMMTLKNMSAGGKTVIFVTHSTLHLSLCDKIAFIGTGGYLCFCGSLPEALRFFGTQNVIEVYKHITSEPVKWRNAYAARQRAQAPPLKRPGPFKKPSDKDWFRQTLVLCKRHLHILINDRVRFLLLLLQAPLLALLISVVADGNQFESYRITKGLLFALACSAFWIGILNSIQEVCKERHIIKREYMTGQRLGTHILSRIFVMMFICAIQAILLTSVFALVVGLPGTGVLMAAYPELLITTFLTALTASAMGIFVSSLCQNSDKALAVAPLLLIPQLLFSGIIFDLNGLSQVISFLVVCRWSMEGYGTTADLNSILPPDRSYEAFYDFTASHQLATWALLCGLIVVFAIAAGIVLQSLNRERSR